MSAAPRFNFFLLVRMNLTRRPCRGLGMILIFAFIAATVFPPSTLQAGLMRALTGESGGSGPIS